MNPNHLHIYDCAECVEWIERGFAPIEHYVTELYAHFNLNPDDFKFKFK